MFGYVTVFKPEMKVKEFEIYNAVYCGLCRHMGKTYGPFSKFCLSYDLTFISLLETALKDEFSGYEQKMCRVNPLKKCTYCKNDGETQDLAAAAGVVLSDFKLRDNIHDSSVFAKPFFALLRLFSKRWCRKAYRRYPELKEIIDDYAFEQSKAESDKECSIDKVAAPSAKAISRIMMLVETEQRYKPILERIGYCLGQLIYLCDVADDLEKDIKHCGFNPISAEAKLAENPLAFAKDRLEPIMNTCLTECQNYSELLEIKKYKPIIDNILYLGLPDRMKKIFKEEKV